MANPLGEMFIMLPMLFLIQKIDFTIPQNVLIVQIAFVTIQTALLLGSAFIYNKINSINNKTKLNIVVSKAGEEVKTEVQTVRDHDMAALKKYGTQLIMGTTITAFLYFKWAIVPPLLMQSVLNPMNFYKNQLFKLYILGHADTDYPRPWKEDNPLAGLMGGNQEPEATPAAADTDAIEDKAPKSKKSKARKDE